jgi:hypothetical protein
VPGAGLICGCDRDRRASLGAAGDGLPRAGAAAQVGIAIDDVALIVLGHELHELPRILAFNSRKFVQFVTKEI